MSPTSRMPPAVPAATSMELLELAGDVGIPLAEVAQWRRALARASSDACGCRAGAIAAGVSVVVLAASGFLTEAGPARLVLAGVATIAVAGVVKLAQVRRSHRLGAYYEAGLRERVRQHSRSVKVTVP